MIKTIMEYYRILWKLKVARFQGYDNMVDLHFYPRTREKLLKKGYDVVPQCGGGYEVATHKA